MNACTLCPRRCRADRTVSQGVCGCSNDIVATRIMLHMWEEPCISGKNGSGAIFFYGCPLGCSFCQNFEISQPNAHTDKSLCCSFRTYSENELADVCLSLEQRGAHNINFVSPTQYTNKLIRTVKLARENGLTIPIVWNTGGYELRKTIAMLGETADVFLTDVKYLSSHLSKTLSGASDYYEHAHTVLDEMLRITGLPQYNADGLMTRGVIVRHLVLPGCRHDSIELLHALAADFGINSFVLSLMSQYTPDFFRGCSDELLDKSLRRRITTFEYDSVARKAVDLGFSGYFQEKSSAVSCYTPKWGVYE